MSYLQSAGYKVVDSELPTLADIIKPIKKFKVTHAERPDIPQVFNIGDKVSFRGKMYFVKYVNPKDHMVQIELAKIRHGKVTGVVTGAIVNVKPDTIFPWGMKPNNKAIQVGGDDWNQKTALRLEYDYARVKPILEKIAAVAVGGKTEVKVKKTSWDDLDSQMQTDIEEKWKQSNYDSFYDSEVENWRENDAETDGRRQVADDFNSGNTPDWAIDAIQEYIDDNTDEGKEFPFDAHQIKKAMSIEGQYDDFSTSKIEVKFDDDDLDRMKPKGYSKDQLTLPGVKKMEPHEYLTDHMRDGIEQAISDAFKVAASDVADNLDPPDYLGDSTNETLDMFWGDMDDDEKYHWAMKNTTFLETDDDKESEGELDALPTKFDPLNETSGKDYERTQALARIMSVERASQLLVERGLMKDIDNARDHIKEIDGDLWQSWKDSSTTTNGMILQVAAAEELGGRLYEHDGLKKNDSIRDADKEFRAIGGFNGIKAYLRGKWETTQYLLDKANIQTMKVYRGIRWTIPFMGSKEEKVKGNYSRYSDPNTFTRYPNAVILRNGCQSCTTTSGVANGWTGADNAKVYRVIAPRTAALSIPAYGINIHSEHEVVLAGVAWQAYDVWKGKAPTFEQVPLESSHMIERMRNPYYPKVDKREMPDIRPAIPYKGWTSKADEYWKKYVAALPKPEKKIDKIDLKKDIDDVIAKVKKKPKFNPGDKISGADGSNFADTEFTVNSLNRNGTMDVTSEYGTPYTGVKPHLFQTSTKVQGKFKVGDKLNYGTVAKYEVVKGPYKTYNNDVGYDIKDSSGKIYKNEVLPSYVTKEEPKSFTATTTIGKDKGKEVEYKVGDLVKGQISGSIYKIDKIGDTSVHFIVQKVSNTSYGPASTVVGGGHQDTITSLGSVYKKVEPEKPKMDSTFKTSEKYQKSLDKFKVGQTVYSQYQPGKGYVITGFMKNGDLDVEEINLKTGKPTYHDAQLVSDFIFTSKEDAKKAPGSNWGKDD